MMAETALLGENMDISKLKVPDLKRELKLRGLSTSGNKTDLMERLQTVLKSKLDDTASAESVDDLDDDLLNDDDLEQEQLDTSESVLTELDEQLNTSTTKTTKRKLSESTKSSVESDSQPPKKIVLNRNPSVTNETGQENQNGNKLHDTASCKSDTSEEKKVVKLSELSAKERLEMRAKKFGAPVTDQEKKVARAQRFALETSASSTATGTSTSATASMEALKKRAERFGGSVSKIMSGMEQQERMERRKERFGVVTTANGATSQSDKAKQRLERFKTPIK